MACPCNCGASYPSCCFLITNCVTGNTYNIYTDVSYSLLLCNLSVAGHILFLGNSSSFITGCYTLGPCQQGPGCQTVGSIYVPYQFFVNSFNNQWLSCNTCIVLRATDCNNSGTIVHFKITIPVNYSQIIGKTIEAAFPGYSQRCWLITYNRFDNPWAPGIPNLVSYNGPFDDCLTCQSGGCLPLTSVITGVDDKCNQKIGSVTITPTSGIGPYTYLWSNNATTSTITGLASGVYSVTFTDVNGCIGTNSITLNNLPCDQNCLITPCDNTISPFVVTNPITTPNSNPNIYVGNIFSGTITLVGAAPLTGCFNMTVSALTGVTGATIAVTFYSYNTCLECNPIAYKIARCDDPNVYYFTNTDLSLVVGHVINNVTFTGCDNTVPFPCNSLANQCWTVAIAAGGIFPVIVTYDSVLYPDCDCCKPC